jgi:hypothetical protein
MRFSIPAIFSTANQTSRIDEMKSALQNAGTYKGILAPRNKPIRMNF